MNRDDHLTNYLEQVLRERYGRKVYKQKKIIEITAINLNQNNSSWILRVLKCVKSVYMPLIYSRKGVIK